MASNGQDVRDNRSPSFLSEIDSKIQDIVLKLHSNPSVPVETRLSSEFAIDELLQARNVIFEFAKRKHRDETLQDGAETSDPTTQKLSTISSFTPKSRRSPTTAADDIKELCLYMFGHRSSFPKSCLSSVSQPKSKQLRQPSITDTTAADHSSTPDPVPSDPISLNTILQAISQVQTDIKLLDSKFSEKFSKLSGQISVSSFSEKETIDGLKKECDALRSTIDMLMSPSTRGAHGHSKPPPCELSRNHPDVTTVADSPTVLTTNRFAVLETEDVVPTDDSDDPRTEAELLIDTYYEALTPRVQPGNKQGCPTPPNQSDTPAEKSSETFHEQLVQYRKKHKEQTAAKTKPPSPSPTTTTAKADVLIIGDSMIKRLQPRKLSRRKRVICHTMRGAKIEDIAWNAKHMSTKHNVSDIILHVGTNNTSDSAEIIASKITSLGESLQPKKVTISSIIHRTKQTVLQRKKVDDANDLLKSIAQRNGWDFIDNTNITLDHLVSDGVHLNTKGVRLLANNIIQHIGGPPVKASHRTSVTNSNQRRTPFGAVSYSDALKTPTGAGTRASSVFQLSNQHYPHQRQPRQRQPLNYQRGFKLPHSTHLRPRDQEWNQYLKKVRELLNPQSRIQK